MSLVDRINVEARTIGGVPWQPWLNPFWRFNIGGPVHPSQQVQGVDNVLGLAAVYSAVRIIADMIASLPVGVYRRMPDGTAVKLGGSQLLDSPSVNGTVYDWFFMGTTSALLWGNAWGLITSRTGVRNPAGFMYPATIEWLPPDRMHVTDDELQPWNPLRAKIYFDGHEVQREELVHLRAFVVPGRTEAISPMRAFATLIAQGLGALNYSHDFFRNGGFPPGCFQNTQEEVDTQSAREIRQRLTDTLRQHEPLVFGRDWEYKAISVPPQEAAFVDQMQLNATQVAAIYGLPPERVGGKRGDSLTYSTEQQETLALITDTLRPWLVRWEQLLSQLLPATQFAKFDVDALLKTDLRTRYEIQRGQREAGLRTGDEIRATDDLPPLPNGQGADAMPLLVLERMAATTRGIPKSFLNSIVLEQELAAELLVKLQSQGLVNDTGKPPVSTTGEQYLGRQITLSRAADEDGNPFGPAHQRATNSDRKRAHDWIQHAHAAGALADDERDSRLATASTAAIKGALGELVKDLPSESALNAELSKIVNSPDGRAQSLPQLPGADAIMTLRELQLRWDEQDAEHGELAGVQPSMNGKGH